MKYFQLAELAEIINGSTPLKSNKKFWDNGTINWFTAEDLRKGDEVNATKKFITKFALENTSIKLVPKDSVLLCCTASIGLIGINKIELTTNQQFNAIVPNKELINYRYLFYFLKNYMSEFEKQASTTTVGFISQKKVKSIPVPVPSLQEQEKIVEKLDKLFENIDKKIEFTDKQIINLEILINSQLKNIFENKENMEIQMRLEDITEKITDGKHGDCENQDQSNFYFLSAKNIKDGKLLYENARQITKKDFEETHKRTDLKPGDLLITNSGTIGRMAIAEENEKTYKTTFQKSVAIVKPNHNLVNNKYLFYYLKNKIINLQNISRGAAQKNLLLRDLRNFIVNLPDSVKSQINTVEKLDSFFSKTKEINILYQNKLNLLATLKKSILDKEFSYE